MMGDLTHGQECTLLNKDMYYDQDWQITDCPCFHHDTENYSCPVQTSRQRVGDVLHQLVAGQGRGGGWVSEGGVDDDT